MTVLQASLTPILQILRRLNLMRFGPRSAKAERRIFKYNQPILPTKPCGFATHLYYIWASYMVGYIFSQPIPPPLRIRKDALSINR